MPTDGEGHVATPTPDAAASLPVDKTWEPLPTADDDNNQHIPARIVVGGFVVYVREDRVAAMITDAHKKQCELCSSRIAALEGANASLVSLLQQLQSSFDSRMESVGASSLDEARFIAPLAYSVDAALKSALASPAGAEGGAA